MDKSPDSDKKTFELTNGYYECPHCAFSTPHLNNIQRHMGKKHPATVNAASVGAVEADALAAAKAEANTAAKADKAAKDKAKTK